MMLNPINRARMRFTLACVLALGTAVPLTAIAASGWRDEATAAEQAQDAAVFQGMDATARDLFASRERERDARERHEAAERELGRAREFETLGRLAGRVAHDLNNALTPVLTHAEWLRDKPETTREDVAAAALKAAVIAFQSAHQLEPNGTIDDALRQLLTREHGC